VFTPQEGAYAQLIVENLSIELSWGANRQPKGNLHQSIESVPHNDGRQSALPRNFIEAKTQKTQMWFWGRGGEMRVDGGNGKFKKKMERSELECQPRQPQPNHQQHGPRPGHGGPCTELDRAQARAILSATPLKRLLPHRGLLVLDPSLIVRLETRGMRYTKYNTNLCFSLSQDSQPASAPFVLRCHS